MKIIDRNIADQTRGIFRKEGGGSEWRDVPSTQGSTQVLSDSDIIELSTLILKIEEHYGFPCDIEWAREGGKFYIVQSRPITTLQNTFAQKECDVTETELIENLSEKKWHFLHTRFRTPFYTYLLWEGVTKHHNHSISFPYEVQDVLYLDKDIAFTESAWEDLRTRVQAELQKNKKFLLELMDQSYALDGDVVRFVQACDKIDFETVSLEEIIQFWNQYIDLSYRFCAVIILPLFIEADMEAVLKTAIREKFPESQADGAFHSLTTPIKMGVVAEEELKLLELAIRKSAGEDISSALLKHAQEFSWMKNNAFEGSYYTIEDYLLRVSEYAQQDPRGKLHSYQEKIANEKAVFKTYRDQFSDTKSILSLIDTLQESIYFRSWRTERFYRNAYYLQTFFKETANLLGCDAQGDLFYLTPDQIISHLSGKEHADRERIAMRKQSYLMYGDARGVWVLSDSGTVRDAKNKIRIKAEVISDVIQGQVAFHGHVTGKVKIVLSASQLHEVAEGDILVTPSTTPDYVPTLKRVQAVITEEGGVLSHASVISRELHIPCIIGTKIATQVLHDGDLVEVDADNGVVRVIEKA
jgi:rifampicin phosphotransferase